MSAPLVLLYNLDTPKGAKIRRMCLPLKIRTRLVAKQEYGLPLSALIEGAAGAPVSEEVPDFDDELLLMANFTGPQVDRFLQGFRRSHIPPVALKAVLTQTNRNWNSAALRAELLRERQAIQQGGSAHAAQQD